MIFIRKIAYPLRCGRQLTNEVSVYAIPTGAIREIEEVTLQAAHHAHDLNFSLSRPGIPIVFAIPQISRRLLPFLARIDTFRLAEIAMARAPPILARCTNVYNVPARCLPIAILFTFVDDEITRLLKDVVMPGRRRRS